MIIIFFTGCKNKNSENKKNVQNNKQEYDIFVYNSDMSIGTAFRKMCDEYTNRTGVIIRTVTPRSEDNTMENLKKYLESEYPPDIFPVTNMQELTELQNTENMWDFSNATEESFTTVVNNIPETLRLSSNTSDSFGVPATVTGFGYIVDPKMIASLFGGDKYRTVISDLQACSYDEFSVFIESLNKYINNNEIYEFSLNKNNYSFVESKGELSQNLTGIFSIACGEEINSGSYLMNPVLASLFSTPAHAHITGDSVTDNLSSALMRYTEALDLITQNISGDNGILSRSSELVSNTKNSHTQAIKRFVSGKSLFLLGTTDDYEEMGIFDTLVAKRCIFIPIKLPFDDYNFNNNLNNKLNKSINIYVPRYYCINSKSSEKEKKAAQDFLVWFKTSDLAAKYVIPEFGYVPYDISDGAVIENSLRRSMVDYISENKTLPGVFQGTPSTWCNETMGKYFVDELFQKPFWDLQDYEDLATYGSNRWAKLKASS